MSDIVPKRVFFTVWVVMIVVTIVNAALAFVRLGPFNSVITMLLGVLNVFLIVWYFIGVRQYRPLLKIIVITGFAWMGIMITLTMADYLSRGWSTVTTRSVVIPSGKAPFEEPALGSVTQVPTAVVPLRVPTALPKVTGVPGNRAVTPKVPVTSVGLSTTTPGRGGVVNITLSARNASFNTDRIMVPRGATVVIHFTNHDSVTHNFSVYRDSAGQYPLFKGKPVKGGQSVAYRFKAPAKPKVYLFRCDFHPVVMRGSFIVK